MKRVAEKQLVKDGGDEVREHVRLWWHWLIGGRRRRRESRDSRRRTTQSLPLESAYIGNKWLADVGY